MGNFAQQCRAYAPCHSTDRLRAPGLGIEDAADRERAEHASNAHFTSVPVDRRFGEMCAEAGVRVGVIDLMKLQFETPARLVKSTPLQTRS
jgi:succinyl-CoA synthetase beta subunit